MDPADRVIPKPNFASLLAFRIPVPDKLTAEGWEEYPSQEQIWIAAHFDMTLPEFEVKYLASKGGAPTKMTADALVAAVVPPAGMASPTRPKELFTGKRDEHPLPLLP